jgi:uncharacterized membrane protein (Fun14 family)
MITFLIILTCVGFSLFLFNSLLKVDTKIKVVVNVIALFIVLLFILQSFGVISAHNFPPMNVPNTSCVGK